MTMGIFIAEEGHTVDTGPLRYDSSMPRLQVDLEVDPPAMDILTFAGGAAFIATNALVNVQEEVILEIPHILPFTPEVAVYFFAETYDNSDSDPKSGFYAADEFLFSGNIGTISDTLFARVDGDKLQIIHQLDNFTPINYTSDANRYGIRLKYYIFSNNSGVDSYQTRSY